MKKYFALAVLGSLQFCASAKVTEVTVPDVYPRFGTSIIIQGGSTNSRIVGYTYLEHNGTAFEPYDSTTYRYSFGRGGELTDDLDDKYVNFEESFTYKYDAFSMGYKNQFWRTQDFNSDHKVLYYTIKQWDDGLAHWDNWGRYVYTYSGDYLRIEGTVFQNYAGGWLDHIFFDHTYDANNHLVEVSSITYKLHLSYDAQGRIVQRYEQSYSFADNSWHDEPRYSFTYNTNNQLTEYIVEESDGSIWNLKTKVEYAYNGNTVETETIYERLNNAWEPVGKHSYQYNALGKKTEDVYASWDAVNAAFTNVYREQRSYNANNQPLLIIRSTWDDQNQSWGHSADDYQYRFYYQIFDPTAVPDLTADLNFSLYPVPANDVLHVDLKDKTASVSIYDLQGRLWNTVSNIAQTESIQVSSLPAGQYILKLTSPSGIASKTFTVIH